MEAGAGADAAEGPQAAGQDLDAGSLPGPARPCALFMGRHAAGGGRGEGLDARVKCELLGAARPCPHWPYLWGSKV